MEFRWSLSAEILFEQSRHATVGARQPSHIVEYQNYRSSLVNCILAQSRHAPESERMAIVSSRGRV